MQPSKPSPNTPSLHEGLSEMEVDWVLWAFPPSFPSFCKYCLITCCVPGPVLGSSDTAVTQADPTLPLQSSHYHEGDRQ